MSKVKTFGKRIKEYRRKKGWTQEMLAKKVGINVNLLGKYERDLHIPHVYAALDIAEALGCSVYELTCYKERSTNNEV